MLHVGHLLMAGGAWALLIHHPWSLPISMVVGIDQADAWAHRAGLRSSHNGEPSGWWISASHGELFDMQGKFVD